MRHVIAIELELERGLNIGPDDQQRLVDKLCSVLHAYESSGAPPRRLPIRELKVNWERRTR